MDEVDEWKVGYETPIKNEGDQDGVGVYECDEL